MHEVEKLYIKTKKAKEKLMSRILRGDYSAAEDVVQEAFTRAWQFYPSFNPNIGTLDTWFNSILFNSLRDYQREMRGEPASQACEICPEDIITSNKLDPVVLVAKIEQVTNHKHRRVLDLFFVMGYTSKEISQIEEGISVSNVTTIVNRFRKEICE